MPTWLPRRPLRGHAPRAPAYLAAVAAMRRRKPRGGKHLDRGGVPVEPDRPQNLSGGAEASLDFESD